MRTLVCLHCGKEFLRNKKLKHLDQHYCGEKACQAARKLSFDRHKYKTNEFFRSDKLHRARDQKKKRADQGDPLACSRYQRDYRASHPDYVLENRQKQRLRNARTTGKTEPETKIVNPDAIGQLRTMEYLWPKIAPMDPIMVKPQDIREWSNEFRLIQPEAVRSMTQSMQSTGQLQPLILLKNDDGYHIIDGIKRYRAALELGLEELQSLVFEVDLVMAKAMILHYNRHSSSLSIYEQGLIVYA